MVYFKKYRLIFGLLGFRQYTVIASVPMQSPTSWRLLRYARNDNILRKSCVLLFILSAVFVTTSTYAKASAGRAVKHSSKRVTSTHINFKVPNINPKVLKLALRAYDNAKKQGIRLKPVLTIIDYSLPSNKKRLWTLDLAHHKVPFYTYVAHGKNSGALKATHFSNRFGSRQSSLGVFKTGVPYYGTKGYSLHLKGLEPGVNDHAYRRAVVVHGAWYADSSFLHSHKRLGLSWGCPAVSKKIVKPFINTIKNGSLIFVYYPNKQWLSHSHFV